MPVLKFIDIKERDRVRFVEDVINKLNVLKKKCGSNFSVWEYEDAFMHAEKVVTEVSKSIEVRKHMPDIWRSDLQGHREAIAQMSKE